jgi:ectoine hydroxylase-related dioxygenase (phytanoyl-CoA dioxygenase family)
VELLQTVIASQARQKEQSAPKAARKAGCGTVHLMAEEAPDLSLPPYMLVASFGLVSVTVANGPIEVAVGTHRMPRETAMRALEFGSCEVEPVPLEIGDILVRHPWALHRGTPNQTAIPRALVSVRYVRRWYADDSRDVNAISSAAWKSLSVGQRAMLRFPVRS